MTKYKIKKGLITQTSRSGITIFDGEKSVLYSMNETATFIFREIKKGLEKDEILKKITDKFNIDRNTAKYDLNSVIENLLRRKIIA